MKSNAARPQHFCRFVAAALPPYQLMRRPTLIAWLSVPPPGPTGGDRQRHSALDQLRDIRGTIGVEVDLGIELAAPCQGWARRHVRRQ
jgi:hypothetical protein